MGDGHVWHVMCVCVCTRTDDGGGDGRHAKRWAELNVELDGKHCPDLTQIISHTQPRPRLSSV